MQNSTRSVFDFRGGGGAALCITGEVWTEGAVKNQLHDTPYAYKDYSRRSTFRKEPVHGAPIPDRMFSLPQAVKCRDEIPPRVSARNITAQRAC